MSLENQKNAAIQSENYDEAKRIKQLIEQIKNGSGQSLQQIPPFQRN